jgi:hypothetical protein
VKEAALLMAMQRIIGGIEVEDDLPRRTSMGVEKQIDQQGFDRLRVVPDLVIGRRLRLAQLEPVERRFAGHRRTVLAPRRELAGEHSHHRVVAQLVVVEHIFVAQRDAEDALADQRWHRVHDLLRRPAVGEATGKAIDQPDCPITCPQQQSAGVRSDLAAIKCGHHRAPLDACKLEQLRATLCRHRGFP